MYNPNPKVTYTPSSDMIDAGTTKGLVEYMSRKEPGVELKWPTDDKPTSSPGLLESLLNKINKKEVPLIKNGGMLGIRG
jgi:hypothetical protein